MEGAVSKHRQLCVKHRPGLKYSTVVSQLYSKMVASRTKRMRVTFAWLYTRVNKINSTINPSTARVPMSAMSSFIRRYKIKMRRVQRKKRQDKQYFVPKIMKWLSTLRKGLIKTGRDKPDYDAKWGHFGPEKRFNVDQIPLPFVVDRKTTYEIDVPMEEKRSHRVWVSNSGADLEKRQCTLQLCFSPVANQPVRIAVIFRGTGKRIPPNKLAAYHKDVDVYWQPNAWADTSMSVQWIKGTLSAAVADFDEFVLFCDNLEAQTRLPFQEEIRELKGVVWYGVPNATDIWQPVDAGAWFLIKKLILHEQQRWLEAEENVEL